MLLKQVVRERHSGKSEEVIRAYVDGLINGGEVERWLWKRVIERMYDEEDFR